MMRLGLLAPQDNGKTSYLVALYAVLVQQNSDDPSYPISIMVKNPIQRRWFNDRFTNLLDEALPIMDRFPKKNLRAPTDYVFTITDKATGFSHDITFVDFPGILLRGAYDQDTAGLYKDTENSLSECDAFIVMLDVVSLIKGSLFSARGKLSPSDINSIIAKATKNRATERSIFGAPVVFCLSKYDLIGQLDGNKQEVVERAHARLVTLFPSIFDKDRRQPLMISSISLGGSITKANSPFKALTAADDPNARRGGPFDPYLIDLPFEFCMSFCSLSSSAHYKAIEDKSREARDKNKSLANRAKQLNFVDSVDEWGRIPEWFSTPSDFYNKVAAEEEGRRKANEIKSTQYYSIGSRLGKRINKSDLLDSYAIYYSGLEHKFKVSFARGELPIIPK